MSRLLLDPYRLPIPNDGVVRLQRAVYISCYPDDHSWLHVPLDKKELDRRLMRYKLCTDPRVSHRRLMELHAALLARHPSWFSTTPGVPPGQPFKIEDRDFDRWAWLAEASPGRPVSLEPHHLVAPWQINPTFLSGVFESSLAYSTLHKTIPVSSPFAALYRKAFPSKRQPRHWISALSVPMKIPAVCIHLIEIYVCFWLGIFSPAGNNPRLTLDQHRELALIWLTRQDVQRHMPLIKWFYKSPQTSTLSVCAVAEAFAYFYRPFQSAIGRVSPDWECRYLPQLYEVCASIRQDTYKLFRAQGPTDPEPPSSSPSRSNEARVAKDINAAETRTNAIETTTTDEYWTPKVAKFTSAMASLGPKCTFPVAFWETVLPHVRSDLTDSVKDAQSRPALLISFLTHPKPLDEWEQTFLRRHRIPKPLEAEVLAAVRFAYAFAPESTVYSSSSSSSSSSSVPLMPTPASTSLTPESILPTIGPPVSVKEAAQRLKKQQQKQQKNSPSAVVVRGHSNDNANGSSSSVNKSRAKKKKAGNSPSILPYTVAAASAAVAVPSDPSRLHMDVLIQVIVSFYTSRMGPSVLRSALVRYLPKPIISAMAWRWNALFASYVVPWPANIEEHAVQQIKSRVRALGLMGSTELATRRIQFCANCGVIHTRHNGVPTLKPNSSIEVYRADQTIGCVVSALGLLDGISYCARTGSTLALQCGTTEAICFYVHDLTYTNGRCLFICTKCGIQAIWDPTVCSTQWHGPMCSRCSFALCNPANYRRGGAQKLGGSAKSTTANKKKKLKIKPEPLQ